MSKHLYLKESKGWETTDGKMFLNSKDALAHETDIKIKDFVRKNIRKSMVSDLRVKDEICDFIKNNIDLLSNVLTELKNDRLQNS